MHPISSWLYIGRRISTALRKAQNASGREHAPSKSLDLVVEIASDRCPISERKTVTVTGPDNVLFGIPNFAVSVQRHST